MSMQITTNILKSTTLSKIVTQDDAKKFLNPKQIDRLIELSKEILDSGETFKNITKKNTPLEWKNFKIQVFSKPEKKSIKFYISPKESYAVSGASKRFNKAKCLKFNFNKYDLIKTKMTHVARLRFSYNDPTSPQEKLALWNKEINILKLLKKKPNICQLKDATKYKGLHKGIPSEKMVMYQELYQSDLIDFVHRLDAKNRHLNSEEMKKIIAKVANGLAELHKEGFVHGDIKLDNIFIDEDTEAYIGDFGLSFHLPLPSKHQPRATAIFYSPERFREAISSLGCYRIGKAVDIWALGCAIVALKTHSFPLWSSLIDAYQSLNSFYHHLPSGRKQIDIDDLSNKLKQKTPLIFKEVMKIKEYLNKFNNSAQNIDLNNIINYFNTGKEAIQIQSQLNDLIEMLTTAQSNFTENTFIESEKDYFLKNTNEIKYFISKTLKKPVRKLSESFEMLIETCWNMLDSHCAKKDKNDDIIDILLKRIFVKNPDNRITIEEIKDLLA